MSYFFNDIFSAARVRPLAERRVISVDNCLYFVFKGAEHRNI
jgi:hypothetical protein